MKKQQTKTMDSRKAEVTFAQIQELSSRMQQWGKFRVSQLGGIVQNPDFITDTNVYENYVEFERQLLDCITMLKGCVGELHEIHNIIGSLCRDIDMDTTHVYGSNVFRLDDVQMTQTWNPNDVDMDK